MVLFARIKDQSEEWLVRDIVKIMQLMGLLEVADVCVVNLRYVSIRISCLCGIKELIFSKNEVFIHHQITALSSSSLDSGYNSQSSAPDTHWVFTPYT